MHVTWLGQGFTHGSRIEQEKLLAWQEYLCVLDDFTFLLSPTLEIFLWGIDKSMLGFSKQFVCIVFVFSNAGVCVT